MFHYGLEVEKKNIFDQTIRNPKIIRTDRQLMNDMWGLLHHFMLLLKWPYLITRIWVTEIQVVSVLCAFCKSYSRQMHLLYMSPISLLHTLNLTDIILCMPAIHPTSCAPFTTSIPLSFLPPKNKIKSYNNSFISKSSKYKINDVKQVKWDHIKCY